METHRWMRTLNRGEQSQFESHPENHYFSDLTYFLTQLSPFKRL